MPEKLSVYSNHMKKAGRVKSRTAYPPMVLSYFGPTNFCVIGLKNSCAVTEREVRWKAV